MNITLPRMCFCLIALAFGSLSDASASVRVVTSFYPVYIATLNVTAGVPGTEVHNLAAPHVGCLHDYQLTTADARELSEAKILLANGAGMETFLGKIRAQNPALKIVEVSEGIPLVDGNPHVWVSPELAARQVDNIAAALSAADAANADRYASNAAAYKAKLSDLAQRMKTGLAPFAGAPVITLHDALPYFARDFGLDIVGVIEREPGHEPRAKELAANVDLVRSRGVRAILAEPQYSDKAAQTIARETGARVVQIDPVATGPSNPTEARGAYLRAMEKNLET
ncbi:MAG: metal ABC transporter substrate-binding protein, partial [Chthoniobacterales bacterium]